MQVVHLRNIDFDRSGHNGGKLEILLLRDFELARDLGGEGRVFRVERAFKLDDRDSGVFDKLDFRDPALVFVLSELLVDLFEQKLVAAVHGVLVHCLVVVAHAAVGVLRVVLAGAVVQRLRDHDEVDVRPVQTELRRMGPVHVDADIRDVLLKHLRYLVHDLVLYWVDFGQDFAHVFAELNYFVGQLAIDLVGHEVVQRLAYNLVGPFGLHRFLLEKLVQFNQKVFRLRRGNVDHAADFAFSELLALLGLVLMSLLPLGPVVLDGLDLKFALRKHCLDLPQDGLKAANEFGFIASIFFLGLLHDGGAVVDGGLGRLLQPLKLFFQGHEVLIVGERLTVLGLRGLG